MKRNSTRNYPCHWSAGITVLTSIVVIALIISGCYIWTGEIPSFMIWLKYALIIVFIATIIGTLAFMPIRLTVRSDKITLHRLIGAIHIPFKDIKEVKAISKSETSGSIRLFGSGGLFGYLGKFRNRRLGNYTMYATNLNELIYIRTDRKIYVFSCKNHYELMEILSGNLQESSNK